MSSRKNEEVWLELRIGFANQHTNCVFHILQEVGAERKLSV